MNKLQKVILRLTDLQLLICVMVVSPYGNYHFLATSLSNCPCKVCGSITGNVHAFILSLEILLRNRNGTFSSWCSSFFLGQAFQQPNFGCEVFNLGINNQVEFCLKVTGFKENWIIGTNLLFTLSGNVDFIGSILVDAAILQFNFF